MRICFVTAGYQPGTDAIGAHTWWLSGALANLGNEVVVFTGAPAPYSVQPKVHVRHAFRSGEAGSIRELEGAIAEDGGVDWLVLQYNPFAFGRWGMNPWLVPVLLSVKRRFSCRLAVIYHELYTQDAGARPSVMRLWQVPQCRRLARISDLNVASCEIYMKQMRGWGCPAESMPVGSNLPLGERSNEGKAGAIVLGTFGTGHVSRRMDWISAAAQAVADQGLLDKVVFVGAGGSVARQHFNGLPMETTGTVSDSEASAALAKLDVFLGPFSDGLTARRGSVAAALQHSVAVVSTLSERTDAIFRAADGKALRLAPDRNSFCRQVVELAADRQRRREMGAAGAKLYADNMDWPVLAKRLDKWIRAKQDALSASG